MLQKKMESMTMIVMPQMTEFVKKDVVLQHMRQTDDIEIQIDIIPGLSNWLPDMVLNTIGLRLSIMLPTGAAVRP